MAFYRKCFAVYIQTVLFKLNNRQIAGKNGKPQHRLAKVLNLHYFYKLKIALTTKSDLSLKSFSKLECLRIAYTNKKYIFSLFIQKLILKVLCISTI